MRTSSSTPSPVEDNNLTLCLIVQTLVELWQPWDYDHSLESLFSVQPSSE